MPSRVSLDTPSVALDSRRFESPNGVPNRIVAKYPHDRVLRVPLSFVLTIVLTIAHLEDKSIDPHEFRLQKGTQQMAGIGKVNRRRFLQGIAGAGMASMFAGCVSPTGQMSGGAPAASGPALAHHYMTGGFAGVGPEDNLIKQIQEDALRNQYGINVDLTFESATWADFDQLLSIRLQTQGTDSLQRDGNRVLNWIAEPGLIRDIDAEMKEYGKNLIEAFPKSGFEYFMRDDGKYTAIPTMASVGSNTEYYHIRRDWCEKVGRDVPQTLEDLEEVLLLFKEQKLGGEVTIPYTPENAVWLTWVTAVGPFVPEPEEQFQMMERGENIDRDFGSIMREPRLELLQRWYRDGLLNPEWATWQSEDVFSAVAAGIVGCFSGLYSNTNQRLYAIEKDLDPSQDWVQIFPPPGIKGSPQTNRIMSTVAMDRGIIVTSWAQAPEAVVALADWQNTSFENYLLCTRGIEGKHWQWGEGGWIEELRSEAPNREYSGMRHTTPAPKWQKQVNQLPFAPDATPKDPLIEARVRGTNMHSRAQTHVPEQGEYPMITQIDHWTPYLFTESSVFAADLGALRDEYMAKIIKGELEVGPGIQEFWDRWYAAGGEIRQKEVTEQYAKYIAAHPEMKDPHIYLAPDVWNTEIQYPPSKSS